MQVHMPK